tara:strand:- start:77 stop:487 length:411 start_codon:yes stop_codon:yes gene_type:complete
MELVKIFRILVVINYIAFMSHFVIDYNSFIVSGTDLSTAIEESFVSIIDSWSFIVLLMIVIAAIITGPLLFFFVKWSRELLVGILVVISIISLIDGSRGYYSLTSEFEVLATAIEALTHGAILAIAYLTPLKDKFN